MQEVIAKWNFLLVCTSTMLSHESYSSKPGNCCLYLRYDNARVFHWSQILSGWGSTVSY
jgi:hypothetical protein